MPDFPETMDDGVLRIACLHLAKELADIGIVPNGTTNALETEAVVASAALLYAFVVPAP